MRARRWTSAGTVLCLVGLALATAPLAVAQETEIDAGGSTFASGVAGLLDSKPGLLIIGDVIHAESPYTLTTFGTTGGATARAASYFPGDGPLAAPALACAAAPICGTVSPPNYPLIAEASHPSKPESKATASGDAQTVGPLSTTPGIVVANASETGAFAEVVASGVGLSGIAAGAVRSTTKQAVEKGVLVMRSEVVLTGVDLPGGLHFDQVRSAAAVRVLPDRTSTGSAITTVVGATVAGIPASIGPSGISVQGQGDGGAAGKAAQAALDGLADGGTAARVLPPAIALEKGKASASTGGVLLTLDRDVEGVSVPVPGAPNPNRTYVGSFTLGGAGVTGFATPAATFDDDAVPTVPVTTAGPGTAGGTVTPPGGGTSTTPADTGGDPSLAAADGSDAAGDADAASDPSVAVAEGPTAPGSDLAPRPVAAGLASRSDLDLGRFALLLLAYPLFVVASAVRRSPSRLPAA